MRAFSANSIGQSKNQELMKHPNFVIGHPVFSFIPTHKCVFWIYSQQYKNSIFILLHHLLDINYDEMLNNFDLLFAA